MPKYHFHIREQGQIIEDPDGMDLPDKIAACNEAVQAAREILSDVVRKGRPIESREFVICDAAGNEVAVVPFGPAL
jgi:hypothetical protein